MIECFSFLTQDSSKLHKKSSLSVELTERRHLMSNYQIEESWKQEDGSYKCPYCEVTKTKRGLASHIWQIHNNQEDIKPLAERGHGQSKQKQCPICKAWFRAAGYQKHTNSCDGTEVPRWKKSDVSEFQKDEDGRLICPVCNESFDKRGIRAHIWRMHTKSGQRFNPNRGYQEGTRESWNKGFTKETSKRVAKSAETLKSRYTMGEITPSQRGKSVSEETKKKISKKMKEHSKAGRLHNIGTCRWKGEPSYPEKFFMKVIDNEFTDKNYAYEYHMRLKETNYSLDFAWPDKKKNIEIDGSQHQQFEEQKERDFRRDERLAAIGWQVMRIRWKDMFHNPQKWIELAKSFIEGDLSERVSEALHTLDDLPLGKVRERTFGGLTFSTVMLLYAQQIYKESDEPKCCAVCGFQAFYTVCHKKPITDFPDTATVKEINALTNLVALCPTHHWQLDHRVLDTSHLQDITNNYVLEKSEMFKVIKGWSKEKARTFLLHLASIVQESDL